MTQHVGPSMLTTIVTEDPTTTGPSSEPGRRRYPGLGRKSCQDTKAFLGSRRKERREDSDDPGVRGHRESPKDSPFFGVGAHWVGGIRGGRRS
jgi:hypothetical protein